MWRRLYFRRKGGRGDSHLKRDRLADPTGKQVTPLSVANSVRSLKSNELNIALLLLQVKYRYSKNVLKCHCGVDIWTTIDRPSG